MGLIVAGATSAGGLTALAVKLARKKNNAKENHSQLKGKEQSRCQPAQSITRK
jgi:hypothetical protein